MTYVSYNVMQIMVLPSTESCLCIVRQLRRRWGHVPCPQIAKRYGVNPLPNARIKRTSLRRRRRNKTKSYDPTLYLYCDAFFICFYSH